MSEFFDNLSKMTQMVTSLFEDRYYYITLMLGNITHALATDGVSFAGYVWDGAR